MRIFWGTVLGLLLFFPGIILLQWITRALGLYDGMSLGEGALVMVMILLTITVVQHWPTRQVSARERERSDTRRAAGSRTPPYSSGDRYSSRRHPTRRSRYD